MKRHRAIFITGVLLILSASNVLATHGDSLAAEPRVAHATLKLRQFPEFSLPEEQIIPFTEFSGTLPDSVAEQRAHANALLQKVLEQQRFVESLDAQSIIDLPVGVVRSGAAFDYAILIDRITFTPEGAMMDVYASLALPQTGTRIAFHGEVPLSAQGGIAGSARIHLLGDHPIVLNGTQLLTIRGTERTYVEFDCSGFLGVSIEADVDIPRHLLVPENSSGNADEGALRINFATYTQSLNDILVRIDIPPFQLAGLPGFGFHCKTAWLDWSDLSNAPGLSLPEGYESPLTSAGLPNLWRGLYLEEIELRLPPAFARRSVNDRIALTGQHLVFDEQGLTGRLSARNLLPDGDMSGWDYTIDAFNVDLIANKVAGLGLTGKISVPVMRAPDGSPAFFGYSAHRTVDGNYMFAVDVGGELKLDLWAAKVTLLSGSSIAVKEKNNRFYPVARLNGELSINIPSTGPKPRFNSLRFENMVINSEAPYFVPGTFAFGREGDRSSLSGFPVVFDNISIKSEVERVGLAFDMLVNISGDPKEESFAAKGGLTIWGKQRDQPVRDEHGEVVGINRHQWEFDQVEVTAVRLNIKKPKVFEFTGELRFFDEDKVYGEGFRGTVRGKIQSIAVHAQALFGRTETFRYWYADALVELKTGIPIMPGVLSAFGFGGGYYSKMKQTNEPLHTALGKSPSGVSYVPDEATVGIRAMVLIGTPRPEAMRGDVALEVVINRHGGINSVTFTGNANFMSTASLSSDQVRELTAAAVGGRLTERLESLTKGQVFGNVRLHFDNVNDIFHGNLEIYVNVAGGIVRGVSAGNKAGWAEMHFARDDWYILIGTPDQPLGLEVARIFKSKSYFMLGKNLPGSPPPPPQVSEILGNIDLDYMRDMNALESGMGIAFGLHFLVDTGDLRFLMFYGRFSAGTGLDFMLKDYGNDYHCAGMSGPIGIDGWYANGQAYAFVMGKIGIKVDLRFYKGTYDILSIGAAAILQAKGPNPFWMKGTVGGYYRILGGLVKGRCRFEVTVGKDCVPVGEQNLLEEVSMIAALSPAMGANDVDVFTAPQVVFNIPVGEVMEITDIENKVHSFRAVLDAFDVEIGGRHISGTLEWNEARDVVVFQPDDILPGEQQGKALARLTFEEKVNGSWQKVRFKGNIVEETASAEFSTAKAPDFIPDNNIAFSYPLLKHVNFLPDEYREGYIQLYVGQPHLFANMGQWKHSMRFRDAATGQLWASEVKYDIKTRRISFPIPAGLHTATRYTMELVTLPSGDYAVDQNVTHIERDLLIADMGGTATFTDKTVEGELVRREAKSLLTTDISTSRYRSFTEKMRSISLGNTIRLSPTVNVFRLAALLKGSEAFDPMEVGDDPLVRFEAILDGNAWYEHHVYPLVYEGYPLLGWMRVRRPSITTLGLPPTRDIRIEGSSHGSGFSAFSGETLVYNLGESVASDFYDLRHQAVNLAADYPDRVTSRVAALILEPLPHIRYGRYRLVARYVIPGIEKVTSTYALEMFNPIPDND